MIRLGYPTQNLTIPAGTNRTCRLASLADAEKVRGLVRANIEGLKTILHWNGERGIPLFRMGQAMIPFASHPQFPYDWAAEHGEELAEAGALARDLGARLSMHPGQYIQPGSTRPAVAERSVLELRYVARLLDLVGGPDSVLVLHLGGSYGDKPATVARFVERLSTEETVLKYLALENDERIWTVEEVCGAARALGATAIADAFHHSLNSGGLTLGEALDLALPTWADTPAGASRGRPKLHLSSQDSDKQPGAHAYSVQLRDWEALGAALDGREADVMIEAKGKEHALVPLGIEL
jgi:UV DNA damage endonuclease